MSLTVSKVVSRVLRCNSGICTLKLRFSGKSMLSTKPELEKEMERRKIEKQKKAVAEQIKKNRNSFEQKMDQQKEKLNLVSC